MTTTGVVLLALVPLLVVEGVGYTRAKMGGEFWRRPLEEKLDHIGGHIREWWVLGIAWVGMLAVTLAGMAGVVFLLADELAWIGFGALVVAVTAWYVGVTIQTAGLAVAAGQYAEAGSTPSWVHPLWHVGWMCELSWVFLANLAYVAIGVAILDGDVLAAWAGWTAIGIGVVFMAAVVVFSNQAFPHLGLLVPLVLGVALLLA